MCPVMTHNPGFLSEGEVLHRFVVRQQELELLLEPLREPYAASNPHRLVLGPRGMGKTMLMQRLAAELNRDPVLSARWHPIVFPEESYTVYSAGELWLEALLHLRDPMGRNWGQIHAALRREPDDQRLHDAALAHLMDFADEQGKRLVLLVENLQMLLDDQVHEDEGWTLRHTLQNERRVLLIATATQRPAAIESEQQPFYELFETLDLAPLTVADCQTLWSSVAQRPLEPQRARAIQILTGGNPRLLVILARFASRHVHDLLGELVSLVDEHTDYFKSHLDAFRGKEQRAFVALAELWNPATAAEVAEFARLSVNEASANLGRLVGKGAVVVTEKRGRTKYYQLAERLYNLYYLMRCRGGPRDRVRAVVGFMKAYYPQEELIQQVAQLASEACGPECGCRGDHFAIYEELVATTRDPQLRRSVIEATPPEFFHLDGAPVWVRESQAEEAADARPDIQELREAVLAEPTAIEAWRRLVTRLLDEEGQEEETIRALGSLLELCPTDARAWNLLWALHRSRQELDLAADTMDKAIRICGDRPQFLANKAIVKIEQGGDDEGISLLERAVALDPENESAWGLLGLTLHRMGSNEKAEGALRHAVDINPGRPLGWQELSSVLLTMGRFEEALHAARQAVTLDPESTRSHLLVGMALSKNSVRMEEAEASLRRAIELNPEHLPAWGGLGDVLRSLGRLEEAEEAYKKTCEMEPESSRRQFALGCLYLDCGKADKAAEAFKETTRLDPSHAWAFNNLGFALARLGKNTEAEDAYRESIRLSPEEVPPMINLGRLLARLDGRREETQAVFRQAVNTGPHWAGAWKEWVDFLLETRPADAVISLVQEALPPEPHPDVLNTLAWTLYKNRSAPAILAQAETWARQAGDRQPDDPSIHHTHACILGTLGRWEEAWRHANQFSSDRRLANEYQLEYIDFFLVAAAAGQEERALALLRSSGNAYLMEPLEAALAMLSGEKPMPPQEVKEVALDIIEDIHRRKAALLPLPPSHG